MNGDWIWYHVSFYFNMVAESSSAYAMRLTLSLRIRIIWEIDWGMEEGC